MSSPELYERGVTDLQHPAHSIRDFPVYVRQGQSLLYRGACTLLDASDWYGAHRSCQIPQGLARWDSSIFQLLTAGKRAAQACDTSADLEDSENMS